MSIVRYQFFVLEDRGSSKWTNLTNGHVLRGPSPNPGPIQWIQWRFWLGGGPFLKMNRFLISLASWVGDTPKSCQWCHVRTPLDGKNPSISRYEIRWKLGEKRKNLGYQLFSYLAPLHFFPKKKVGRGYNGWKMLSLSRLWKNNYFWRSKAVFVWRSERILVDSDISEVRQWSSEKDFESFLEIRLQICSMQNRPRDLKSCI